jgi:hypothetical protein
MQHTGIEVTKPKFTHQSLMHMRHMRHNLIQQFLGRYMLAVYSTETYEVAGW